jgi:hypothetical protein
MSDKFEITPKADRSRANQDSGKKTALPRKKKPRTVHSFDYNISDPSSSKAQKNYLGPVAHISKSCKHTVFIEMLSYASTSPRPILSSEESTPVTCELSNKGSEFNLLASFITGYSKTLVKAMKTFILSMISGLPSHGEKIGFLRNSLDHNRVRLLFMPGNKNFIEEVCREGWIHATISPRSIILTRNLQDSEKFGSMNGSGHVMLALVDRGNMRKLYKGVYSVDSLEHVVPAYMAEYE